ncbi:hypothetical protein AJ79_04193 [Helicocarpus griseus UAMH5409]|uniref:Cyanovirin-N domain-containing protein n=1 Tax=Helicocarpus griseus UAMH5409 TaxID=1447875 RepID=A0A2B7XVB4_9EURO|nr:hypothetical protein AJ79_04193 [Helicocarpus griseus UAMH5409]
MTRLLGFYASLLFLAPHVSAQSFPTISFGTATTCENNEYKYEWYVWLQSRDPCLDWRPLGPTALRSPCGSNFGWEDIGHFVFTDCDTESDLPRGITWVEEGMTAQCVGDTQLQRSCDAPWCGAGQVVNITTLQVCTR